MTDRRRQGPVEKGTRAELRLIKGMDRSPGLCAQALEAAQAIDGTDSARDKATLLNALRATILELRGIEPAKVESSPLDQIKARREERRARAARGAAAEGL